MAEAKSICACGSSITQSTGRGRPRIRCHECSPHKHVTSSPRPKHSHCCEQCEESFEGRADSRYCGPLCRGRAAYAKRSRIPCRICGLPTGWVTGDKSAGSNPKHNACAPEHGTASRYARGCRCQECRDRVAQDNREYLTRRVTESPQHLRCAHAGCDRTRKVDGLCGMHLKRKQRADGTWKPSPSDAWDTPKRLAGYKRRKAMTRGGLVGGDRFLVGDLLERDGSDCGICGTSIPDTAYPDPQSASIDHITPLSLGGQHTMENARAAHLRCNIVRGNRD